MKNKLSAVFNSRPLLLATVPNLIYNALMAYVPFIGMTNLIVVSILWEAPRSEAQVNQVEIAVECAGMIIFAIFAFFIRCQFKAWCITLPVQYALGVAVGWISNWIAHIADPLVVRAFSSCISLPIHFLLRPLVLLAIQTLIIYLRHRRRLRRRGGSAGQG